MGDAGEGLIDADSRIQERLEELARNREERAGHVVVRDPEAHAALESLKLARTELQRQAAATVHEARRQQLAHAIAELDRRIDEATARLA
jgi:hypothetical protein